MRATQILAVLSNKVYPSKLNPLSHFDFVKYGYELKMARRKKKSSRWKPGRFPGKRQTIEYANWRLAVLRRDKNTCAMCGVSGCKVEAHHILAIKGRPDLMLDIDNGETLCIPCHKFAHAGVLQEYKRRY